MKEFPYVLKSRCLGQISALVRLIWTLVMVPLASKQLLMLTDRLFLDCMMGDQTLFTRADEVEAAWQVVTPALSVWDAPADSATIPKYEAGTWEPAEAELLINQDGRRWRRL